MKIPVWWPYPGTVDSIHQIFFKGGFQHFSNERFKKWTNRDWERINDNVMRGCREDTGWNR